MDSAGKSGVAGWRRRSPGLEGIAQKTDHLRRPVDTAAVNKTHSRRRVIDLGFLSLQQSVFGI